MVVLMVRESSARIRVGVTLLAIVCAALAAEAAPAFASGNNARMDEYRVRAAFLLKFAKFVQWPRDGSLTFCVTGDEEFGFAITTTAGAANGGNGRDVVVHNVSPKSDFSKCDMVYVGRVSAQREHGDQERRDAETETQTRSGGHQNHQRISP